MATVVDRYYDEGKLGSPGAIHRKWFSGIKPSAYLEPDGRLKPFVKLPTQARLAFESWMHGHVELDRNRIGDEVEGALNQTRQSSINTGKPCKQVIEPGFAVTN